jgi:hypothetical protein
MNWPSVVVLRRRRRSVGSDVAGCRVLARAYHILNQLLGVGAGGDFLADFSAAVLELIRMLKDGGAPVVLITHVMPSCPMSGAVARKLLDRRGHAGKADLQRVQRLPRMLAQALVIERLNEAAEAAR